MSTIGQQMAKEYEGTPEYDPNRKLQDDEYRCPDCGFISRVGTAAEQSHDNLCSETICEDCGALSDGKQYCKDCTIKGLEKFGIKLSPENLEKFQKSFFEV